MARLVQLGRWGSIGQGAVGDLVDDFDLIGVGRGEAVVGRHTETSFTAGSGNGSADKGNQGAESRREVHGCLSMNECNSTDW